MNWSEGCRVFFEAVCDKSLTKSLNFCYTILYDEDYSKKRSLP